MRAERFRPLLAAALLWLAGCGTTEERPDDKAELLGPPSQRIDLPDFEYQWDSIDRDERGGREPFAVARWVTERQNAVSRCLAAEPPAWEQARERRSRGAAGQDRASRGDEVRGLESQWRRDLREQPLALLALDRDRPQALLPVQPQDAADAELAEAAVVVVEQGVVEARVHIAVIISPARQP